MASNSTKAQEPPHPDSLSKVLEPMDLENEEGPVEQTPGERRAFTIALAGVLLMVISTWFLVFANDPASKGAFAFHPPLQSLAIGLFSCGILTLQPTSLAQPKAKARGFSRHQAVMLYLGVPSIVGGTFAIWYAHAFSSSHHHHAKSWHGILGISALTWMAVQIILGAGSVWFGGRLFGNDPKRMYKYHRVSGYLLMILFLIVAHLGGAWSNFAIEGSNPLFRFTGYLVGPALIIIGIATRIRFDKMPILG